LSLRAAWVASLVVSHLQRSRWPKGDAEECRALLLEAEALLAADRKLVPLWSAVQQPWASTTNGGVRASTFALAAVVLERHIFVTTLPPYVRRVATPVAQGRTRSDRRLRSEGPRGRAQGYIARGTAIPELVVPLDENGNNLAQPLDTDDWARQDCAVADTSVAAANVDGGFVAEVHAASAAEREPRQVQFVATGANADTPLENHPDYVADARQDMSLQVDPSL
jgi:hypothetical protein